MIKFCTIYIHICLHKLHSYHSESQNMNPNAVNTNLKTILLNYGYRIGLGQSTQNTQMRCNLSWYSLHKKTISHFNSL
jgi:hypothetical protein